MTIKQAFLLDAEFIARKNALRLIFKELGNGRVFALYDHEFEPYFSMLLPNDDVENLINQVSQTKVFEGGETIEVKRTELIKKKWMMQDKDFLKVITKTPSHVPKLRDSLKKFAPTFEFNIPFYKRYLADKDLTPCDLFEVEFQAKELKSIKRIESDKKLTFRTMAFDIETLTKTSVNAKDDDCIMISYAYEDEAGVLTHGNGKLCSQSFVKCFESEKEMLEGFAQIVRDRKIDILCSYNGDEFDLPYLQERARVTKANFNIGRVRSKNPIKIKAAGLRKISKVSGRIHLDVYAIVAFLNRIGTIKLERLTLNAAYNELFGKQKVDLQEKKIHEIWEEKDKDKLNLLAEYSKVDSIACLEIAGKFIELEIQLSKICGLPLQESSRSTTGQMIEFMMIKESFKQNFIVPNTPSYDEIMSRQGNPIQGAYVKTPEAGVYENLAVFDFKSLYPSIIVSYNIDPMTLNLETCTDFHTSPTGAKFCSESQGIVPKTLNDLLEKRFKVKKQAKELVNVKNREVEYTILEARQWSLKILANSFYGYLGYERSRYYSRACAESVTAYGRKFILETIEKAESNGFKVIASDTDSIFILRANKPKDEVTAFQGQVNRTLPGNMELELEDFYPRGLFVSKKGEEKGAKKKYALINEAGKIKIRGFELVRRDWSKIARTTQTKVLEIILKEGSLETAVKFVKDTIDQVRMGKIPLKEFIILTGLRKAISSYEIISPEVSAAQKAAKAGIPTGDVVAFIISKNGASISEKALPVELVEKGKTEYDAEYYVNNQILPAVLKILSALGFDAEELKQKGSQKSLSDW